MTIFPNLDGYNPYIITEGPDGAMWFTNFGGGAIGRITAGPSTAGRVTFYTRPQHRRLRSDHVWSRRGAVVHQPREQLDRADHHDRGGDQLHRPQHLGPVAHRGRARRGPVVHQQRQQLDRADHHRRDGDQLHRHRHLRTGWYHGRTGWGAVVHQHRQRLDRADHHRREW